MVWGFDPGTCRGYQGTPPPNQQSKSPSRGKPRFCLELAVSGDLGPFICRCWIIVSLPQNRCRLFAPTFVHIAEAVFFQVQASKDNFFSFFSQVLWASEERVLIGSVTLSDSQPSWKPCISTAARMPSPPTLPRNTFPNGLWN